MELYLLLLPFHEHKQQGFDCTEICVNIFLLLIIIMKVEEYVSNNRIWLTYKEEIYVHIHKQIAIFQFHQTKERKKECCVELRVG